MQEDFKIQDAAGELRRGPEIFFQDRNDVFLGTMLIIVVQGSCHFSGQLVEIRNGWRTVRYRCW